MQVIALPPDFDDYPEHDHAEMARRRSTSRSPAPARSTSKASASSSTRRRSCASPADTKRKVHAGPEGMRMLVIGGCPGKAYEDPAMTELESASA